MIKNDYGFKITHIQDLGQIQHGKHNVWNGISFYTRKNPEASGKLIVTFHGANNSKDGELMNTPLFRGYDWNIGNADLLCLSDKIQEEYRQTKLILSWYLDTERHKYWDKYLNIVNAILECNRYDEVVFIGTSGGGIPAYRMASYFNQSALISNPQIEINKYAYYPHYKKIIEENKDRIIYMNTSELIAEYNRQPRKITYLCNAHDHQHIEEHARPFTQEIIMQNQIDIRIVFFNDHCVSGKSPHLIYSPRGKTILDYI